MIVQSILSGTIETGKITVINENKWILGLVSCFSPLALRALSFEKPGYSEKNTQEHYVF